jgi:hypothetical protein
MICGVPGDLLVLLDPGGSPASGLATVDEGLPIHLPCQFRKLVGVEDFRDADEQV